MAQIASSNKGFTLIEVIMSILIISVVFLALLHSLILCMRYNLLNNLRNEAAKIAQGCAEQIRIGQSCPNIIIKNFRKFSVTYNISAPNPATFSSGINEVAITVSYTYGGKNYSYAVRTVIYKE